MRKEKIQKFEANRVLTEETDFNTIETYKSIRTSIMFSIPKSDKGKVIVVTSSSPNEGKTTTSINLAIAFAQMGAKVILIDADLRKARVHKYMDLERTDGLSNVLCGFTDLDKAIKHDIRENLDCLTAGAIPPNPAELLETEEFGILLNTLRETYDYIFVDTPPVTVVTDAIIATKHSTGAIVIVRENFTNYDFLDETMQSLKIANAKILGVIMVDCSERTGRYGYYKRGKYGYKHKYSHRYGYKYGYNYRYGDEVEENKKKK